MFTAYARFEDLSEEDFVEVYESFNTKEEAEKWVSDNLNDYYCLDSYLYE